MASPRALRPLMVLKLVLSQAQKPDSLQTLIHHLTFFTSQMDTDIPLRGEEYHTALMLNVTYLFKEILGINHLDFTDYSKIYPDIASLGAF
jgi:hypothetical protein